MKRTVLINGEEVDIRDIIAGPTASVNRVFNVQKAENQEKEEQIDPEIEKLTIILEISIRSHFKDRHFGAGGYRFYD